MEQAPQQHNEQEPSTPSPPVTASGGMGPRQRKAVAVLAGLIVVAGAAVFVVERSTRPEPTPSPSATSSTPAPTTSTTTVDPRASLPAFGPYPAFGPGSVFAADVSAAPLAPDGAAKVAYLAKNVAENWGGVASLNVDKYGAGFAVAAADTPKVDVRFHDCQKKGGTPPGLYDGPKYFSQVPIPADAVQAPASDGHLAVWDPTQDKLWEFWVASKGTDGRWQACWGGRIDKVSTSNGQFPPPYGVGAAGLATAGYMVTLEEAKQARIEHALGLVVMEAAPGHVFPANRDDGTSDNPAALQEGMRLRLDPSLDVETLPMNPLGKAVARAAQKYGFIVCDKGGAVAVMAETGDRWQKRTGQNPWASLGYGGEPYRALQGFPWEKVQLIRPGWGAPAS